MIVERKPSRPPQEGCAWQATMGAGLHMFTQYCYFGNGRARISASETLSGFNLEFMAGDAGWHVERSEVVVYKKDPSGPVVVLASKNLETANLPKDAMCALEEIPGKSIPGIKRYQLVPTGLYKVQYDRIVATKKDEVPALPCDDKGLNADWTSYFKFQEAHPDTLLYVNIGQEQPLFDETQIEILR